MVLLLPGIISTYQPLCLILLVMAVLSREFWSWKFWSARPRFSLENMVRLCNNWSGLKTLLEENTTRPAKSSLGNSQRTWRSSKLFAVVGRVSHAIILIKAHHPYLHELATPATYFAYQTISLRFVILYRHFDTNVCR